jgi:hypothetical protein
MKLFNFVLLAALLSFAAACGKDNKSGGGGRSSSLPVYSPINIGQPINQSLAQIKAQLSSKNPSQGLALHQTYDFYTTTINTNTNSGSWFIFNWNFSTSSSSTSNCEEVRVSSLSTLSIYVKSGSCSSYKNNSGTAGTYQGLNDISLRAFLDLPEGMVVPNGVRAGKVYYMGQQYDAYAVTTYNNEQFVVSPAMPLMLNPVLKRTPTTTEGVVGAQVSIY